MADNDQQAAQQESFITAGQLPMITSNRAPIQSRKWPSDRTFGPLFKSLCPNEANWLCLCVDREGNSHTAPNSMDNHHQVALVPMNQMNNIDGYDVLMSRIAL